MRRAVLTTACAVAAAMALWGCGGPSGADRQGNESADMRENGSAETAGAQRDESAEPVDVQGSESAESAEDTDARGNDGAGTADAQGSGSVEGTDRQKGGAGQGAAEPVSLAGTTFSIVGDSISTFEGYNPEGYAAFFPQFGDVKEVEDTWWQQVADELELTLCVNASSSGSTVAGDSTGTEDPQCACNELRTNHLANPEGTCPDRIVIYMGANDMLEAFPLGDNDGTRLVEDGVVENFSDAYTLMIDKLQVNYPQAKIYCCTLLPMGDYGTKTPYVEFVNGRELTSADYGEVIAKIAKMRGLPVIDLFDCGVAIDNLQEMSTDGVHPTSAGMRCIADAVKEAFVGRRR